MGRYENKWGKHPQHRMFYCKKTEIVVMGEAFRPFEYEMYHVYPVGFATCHVGTFPYEKGNKKEEAEAKKRAKLLAKELDIAFRKFRDKLKKL